MLSKKYLESINDKQNMFKETLQHKAKTSILSLNYYAKINKRLYWGAKRLIVPLYLYLNISRINDLYTKSTLPY